MRRGFDSGLTSPWQRFPLIKLQIFISDWKVNKGLIFFGFQLSSGLWLQQLSFLLFNRANPTAAEQP